MPGPGGGARGGGFGGGSRGGGFGGGGHRGGYGAPRRHYYGGFGFGPHFYFGPRFYGGGCLSGLFGLLMMPLLMLATVGFLLFGIVGSAITNVANGGVIGYNEATFQEYAIEQYYNEFSNSKEFESNLLVVFLTNEENDGYYCIAIMGDDVHSDINAMFGNEGTAFGSAMLRSINEESYQYSLSQNLAMVMDEMTEEIGALGLGSSFKPGKTSDTGVRSHVTNLSDVTLNEGTVNDALVAFTAETDIPVVIVVDTMEHVFGKYMPMSTVITLVMLVAIAGIAVYLIVRILKQKKQTSQNRENASYAGGGGANHGNGDQGSNGPRIKF